MKKFFLFFMIFMLFGVLSAQEAQEGPAASQNEPAVAAEETGNAGEAAAENQEAEAQNQEEEKVPEMTEAPAQEESSETKSETSAQPEPAPAETENKKEDVQPEPEKVSASEPVLKEEKPSRMFYQPSVGLGIGASIFSLRVNNDFDFLLKHARGGTDVYMGLEIDFRYSPYLDDHAVYEIPVQLNMMFDFPVKHRNIKHLALWFSAGIDLAFGYLFYYDYDHYDEGKDRDTLFKVMAAWGFGVNMLFHNDITLKLGFDSFYGKYPDIICATGYRF